MGKMLVVSQSENDTWFVSGISIGKREPRNVWGDRIKEVLAEKVVSEEDFVLNFGNSYQEHIRRVLKNEEFPKKQVFDKILDFLGKEATYFHDKQLQNVIVNDARLIMAEYETDARALEVKKQLDEIILENYSKGNPIILKLPKE